MRFVPDQAIAGPDPRDPATRRGSKQRLPAFAAFLSADGLRGARIGVARGMAGTDARVLRIFDDCILAMRQQGAVIVDPVTVPHFKDYASAELDILFHEFKADLNRYLASLRPARRVRTLEDVIKFNEANRDRVMPYFGQERMLKAQQKGSLFSDAYRKAREKARRLSRAEGIDIPFRRHRLDAIVVPTGGHRTSRAARQSPRAENRDR